MIVSYDIASSSREDFHTHRFALSFWPYRILGLVDSSKLRATWPSICFPMGRQASVEVFLAEVQLQSIHCHCRCNVDPSC